MKKGLLFAAFLFSGTFLFAQVTFTNQSTLIGNYADYSEVAVDVNNDYLDDYVRISQNGVGIDYQLADHTFNSVWIPMNIQNVPDWSVAAGDLDDNGHIDFVMGHSSRVSFLMANNDGTGYSEITHPEYIFSQRSTIADIDNDGDLDAFVCHDVDLSHPYRNDGNGNMTLDQTLIQTISAPGNYAAIWVDYDNDGDQDMYLTKCRSGASPGDPFRDNAMYTNDGNGVFTENAGEIGMKDNSQSWATVFEDFDNDGDFDAFIVNHDFQNKFMLNDGTGHYTDIIDSTLINPDDLGAWENQSGDFDNNGFIDIFSEMSNELYLNNGDLTFTGMNLTFDEGAIGDFNNDGFLDVVNDGNLFINTGNTNNWVKFTLEGVESNPNGIGARIQIMGNWGTQMREVRSGQGFSHMNSLTAHFGIGTETNIDQVVVTWPSGTVDIFDTLDPNMQHVIVEGSSPLGTTDFNAEKLSFYPNPSTGILNISEKGFENSKVRIIDVNGKIVLTTYISSENNVNVTSIPSGIYFLQLTQNTKSSNFKFIKK